MRLLIIFNPAAGRRRRRRLERVVAALERRGCTVVVRETAGHGDAERLARLAEPEFDRIVVAGGDGTINEAVNGLAATPRPLALIPLGTANVLAGELRLPGRARRLAAVISDGAVRPIWPARANGRLFLCCLGAGFDADVAAAVDPRLKARLGKLAFVFAIIAQLWRYRPQRLAVRAGDGRRWQAAAVVIVKSRFYAGRFVLARGARAGDPAFHAVLFRRVGRLAVLRGLAAMLLGGPDCLRDATVVTARSVVIEAEEAVRVEADGEPAGWLPVAVAAAAAPVLVVHPR